ncbi:unnamed protein product [Urochloa decumbens]|uniref:Uncharacterized protein n=1 Tax=Urochloa decumbens TaxID=240449 RepID=A0ABC9ARK5_9POAL
MRMSRKRLVYLMVSLFLVLATIASTSQSVETEGCFGWWCPPRRRSPPPPRRKTPCFAPYSLEHCNVRDCGSTCRSNSFNHGGWCKPDYHPLCCCYS